MPENSQQHLFVIISDPQVNHLLERILQSAGYVVSVAREISAAEKMIEGAAPTLVIIGDRLIDGSGLTFAGKLLERFPAIPILLFVSQDTPDLLKAALRTGIADYLCPPLHANEVLQSVQTSLTRAKNRKDWVILETKRATASLQNRVDEMETLARLGQTITATLELDQVLSAVVDAAVELTGAEEGSLLLLDEASGELYMRAARNFQEEFVRTFRLPIYDTLAGRVIRSGQPVLLDERTPQKIKTSYLVHALLYVPLKLHGHTFGVLGVDNRQSQIPFSDRHTKLLSAMADYAVIAIENARLYSNINVDRDKLENILTKVQDGTIVIGTDGRLLLINQTVRDAFKLPTDSLNGKLASEVFQHPDLLELINTPDGGFTNRAEIAVEDGRVFSAQPTTITGVGLVVTMHDITYLKKLDRIKSDFVNTVSHDLRSPLTAILGYVELIERVGPTNDLQRDFVRRTQVSVHNITSLVDDLLNLGRIEAGFEAHKEIVHLDSIIRYSAEGFNKVVTEKNLQLKLSLPEELPPLLGNPAHLRQMIDNLLENATRYTPNNGSVSVRANVDENQIILQVSDTGVGIPALDMPYIFDKFYRASNVAADFAGTGLGLPIVKSIVENHQGRIWVESNVGQGTTFTIVMPIAQS